MKRVGNRRKIFSNRIQVTFSNNPGFFIIDRDDVWILKNRTWRLGSHGYAMAFNSATGKADLLHRCLTNAPKRMWVDHKNNVRWNNLRSNLRICSPSENRYNSIQTNTLPAGVSFDKARNKYCVSLKRKNGSVMRKRFKSLGEATQISESLRAIELGDFSPYRRHE